MSFASLQTQVRLFYGPRGQKLIRILTSGIVHSGSHVVSNSWKMIVVGDGAVHVGIPFELGMSQDDGKPRISDPAR